MIRQNNNKGFTLVELLVAITILGIIMAIAIPQLSNIQNNNKTTKYKKYADTIIASGKLYTDAYTEDMFGNNKSGCIDIPYTDMDDKDLIKDIKVSGATCKSDKTFIRVRKANDHYFYEVSVSCKDKDGKVVYEELLPADACNGLGPDTEGPKIIISPNTIDWTKGVGEKLRITVWDEYGMLENTKINLIWLNPDGTVLSEKTHSFKNKRYDASTEETALSIDTKVPQGKTGIYKLKVTPIDVRDSLGNYQINPVISGDIKLDNTPPTVPSAVNMYKWTDNATEPTSATDLTAYTEGSWTNKYIYTYPGESIDDHAKGVYYRYKTTGAVGANDNKKASSTNINKQGTSTIAWQACDKLGNCSAYTTAKTIKMDLTNPECTNSGDSTSWTGSSRTIYWGCSDDLSECNSSYSGSSQTFSSTTKTTTIASYTIKDNAGNTRTCEARTANVYVDTTPPKCTNSGDSTTWTKDNRKINYGCDDDESGCKSSYSGGSQTFTSTTTTSLISSYTIKDNVGNTRTCDSRTANVYVDKTAPTISSIYNPTGGSVTDTAFALTLYGEDYHSGIAKWRYKYAASSGWINYSNSATSPFTTTDFSAARNEDVYISVCDAVGNCSDTSKTRIYIVSDLCSSTTTTWTEQWSACSASCGGGTQTMSGTKYSNYNSKDCGSDTKTQSCNTQTCCSSTKTTWTEQWSACSASCGGGTQTMSGTKYSIFDNSDCGPDQKSQACNTQSCCSVDNPTGCPKKHACLAGNTSIYNIYPYPGGKKDSQAMQGIIPTTVEVYIVDSSQVWNYVYIENGGKFNHSLYTNTGGKENYGYIRENCLADWGIVCFNEQCPVS